MSDAQQIERDLRDYLEKEPNLSRSDRLKYLQVIFHKHLEVNNLEHRINAKDLFLLLSEAARHYTMMKLPVIVSNKCLEPKDSVHVAVIEAFIMYLGRTKLLRKVVKLDYTE